MAIARCRPGHGYSPLLLNVSQPFVDGQSVHDAFSSKIGHPSVSLSAHNAFLYPVPTHGTKIYIVMAENQNPTARSDIVMAYLVMAENQNPTELGQT